MQTAENNLNAICQDAKATTSGNPGAAGEHFLQYFLDQYWEPTPGGRRC